MAQEPQLGPQLDPDLIAFIVFTPVMIFVLVRLFDFVMQ